MKIIKKNKKNSLWIGGKKYIIAIASIFLLLLATLLPLKYCSKVPVTSEIKITDNLTTKGYISFYIPNGILAKIKISREKIDNDSIDWHNVKNSLRSKDTLYPKSNCYIYIHSYSKEKNQTDYSNYSFNFDFKKFVQQVLLNYNDEVYKCVARDLLSDVENNPICFDNGATDVEIIDSYWGIRNNIIGFISENPQLYKIDSISFYDTNNVQEKDFRIKKYPRIKYIKIK